MYFDEEHKFSRSSYRIAEKNRLAKFNFLNQNSEENFQRGINTRRSMPERHYGDLKVPGTPVCSRRVMSMKNGILTDSVITTDNSQDTNIEINQHLKSFVQAIENLSDPSETNDNKLENDVVLRRRQFSISDGAPLGISYPKYSSVPGTPVSSRHVMMLSDKPDKGEETFDELRKKGDDGKDQLQEFIQSMEKLRAHKNDQEVETKENKPTFGYNTIGDYNSPSILKRFPSRSSDLKITELSENVTSNIGIDLLASTNLVRQNNNNDGFYTRTYSRRISREEQEKFDKENDDLDSTEKPEPILISKPYTRISFPITSTRDSQPSRIPIRRSISNTEKFYEILNKFKNMK